MTKPRPQQPSPTTTKPAYDTTRLVVWGERRKEPDWDTFVAALLAYAIAQVEGDKSEDES